MSHHATINTVVQRIAAQIRRVRAQANNIFVAICANIKPPSARLTSKPYEPYTEYLSILELSDLLTGFQKLQVTHKHYSEEAISTAIESGILKECETKHIIVYSGRGSAQTADRSCRVPTLCRKHNIATCVSTADTIALVSDKHRTFSLLRDSGFPIPEIWILDKAGRWLHSERPPLGHKVIAKPCYESASIGIDSQSVGSFSQQFETTIKRRGKILKQPMMVQTFIPGYEIETPILRLESAISMPPIGIQIDDAYYLGDSILDYRRVYTDAYSFFPFETISPAICHAIQEIAEAVGDILRTSGICRVDFRVTRDGEPFITDVNALPHLTHHSSCNAACHALGLTYPDLLATAISSGIGTNGQLSDQNCMSDIRNPNE